MTENDMVGGRLQDQEEQDREQYVFLTHAHANMEHVVEQLDDLTKHMKLSMGEELPEAMGPAMDGPQRVEVVDLFPRALSSCVSTGFLLLGGLAVSEMQSGALR